MAIEFVGGNTAGKVGATSGTSTIALNSGLTGGIASSVSAGDLVIAAFATGSTADRTLSITDGSSEYTQFGSEQYSDDVFDTNLRVAYKFMGGTPDTATTFGPTGNAADSGAMAVYVFRGVDTGTVNDVVVQAAAGASTSRANPPSITPTTAGAYPVCVGAAAHNGGVDTFTSSDLTDFLTTGGSNDTNDVTLGIGHKPDWSSGPFDAAAFGHSQADSADFSWAAKSLVLRPLADTTDDLLAEDVASASSVTTPAIGQAHVLNAADVASASSVTVPVLGQVHALTADDVASASNVTEPAIALVTPLLAEDVASASSVSTPAVGQVHALLANDVAAVSSVTAPVLAEEAGTDALLANSVSSASSVSRPALAAIGAEEERRGGGPALGEYIRWSLRREREERDGRRAVPARRQTVKRTKRKPPEHIEEEAGLAARLSPFGLKEILKDMTRF